MIVYMYRDEQDAKIEPDCNEALSDGEPETRDKGGAMLNVCIFRHSHSASSLGGWVPWEVRLIKPNGHVYYG